jgi:Poly(R)-hydroxyalkanoic acid synthase subunit (PHA_synth_III_E)
MTSSTTGQPLLDLWKRQIEEGAKTWTKLMAATTTPGSVDPAAFWRPFTEQGLTAWSRIMSQGPVSPDLMTQWKQFLDQGIEAWSKAFGQVMGTEAFARASGKCLDHWLVSQGPAKKAAEQFMETTLETLGLPSRTQVTNVARQLVELEERMERLEDGIAALLKRREWGEVR